MTAAEFIKSQEGVERRYETEHGVFVIRDLWVLDASNPYGFRFGTCQFAVRGNDGATVWKPCAEGSQFSDIEPFEQVTA